MNKNKKHIWVTAQRAMLHSYPKAHPKVVHLRNIHRHLFKVKVYIEIEGSRDIEFLMFKDSVEVCLEWCENNTKPTRSCEDISDYLHEHLSMEYPNREIIINVSEDGENGCLMTYPK